MTQRTVKKYCLKCWCFQETTGLLFMLLLCSWGIVSVTWLQFTPAFQWPPIFSPVDPFFFEFWICIDSRLPDISPLDLTSQNQTHYLPNELFFIYFLKICILSIFFLCFSCWPYCRYPHFLPLCPPPSSPHSPSPLAITTLLSVSMGCAYMFLANPFTFFHLVPCPPSLDCTTYLIAQDINLAVFLNFLSPNISTNSHWFLTSVPFFPSNCYYQNSDISHFCFCNCPLKYLPINSWPQNLSPPFRNTNW